MWEKVIDFNKTTLIETHVPICKNWGGPFSQDSLDANLIRHRQ